MNPAACARAKKAERLARKERERPAPPEQLPATPEEARRMAWREYRRHTRPFRRTFRGIISRREAERFVVARVRRTARVIEEVQGERG